MSLKESFLPGVLCQILPHGKLVLLFVYLFLSWRLRPVLLLTNFKVYISFRFLQEKKKSNVCGTVTTNSQMWQCPHEKSGFAEL